ncbi:ABC transporter ATP-binding protein [Pseudocitrobacter sp. 73]|uniref:ABC transporter ATP-binding protein n=1 Tax=Pseudocitrobacter sp. 73 TaxID=2605731 RepID=UPI0011ED982F|nr:ABC transporter ATP-binding protein [Pseudocitrobacter sp. 73]KAA1047022.1 ABC transporter ATP-binding protein [Pseudocitrobacter sp. 73]
MTIPHTNLPRGDIAIRRLHKAFSLDGQPFDVFRDLNLHIESGQSIAIVGPSGCGKTTLLRILAGLEQPDAGEVVIDGRAVQGMSRERAVIFQEPRLLPWLSVLDNVSFSLDVQGKSKAQARLRAQQSIELVGLSQYENALPGQLSGGMAQRVGIARALAIDPEILLLDEPLGALDAMTKITMQEELERIRATENITMVLVTHDLEEAIYLADRVLILPKVKGNPIRIIDVNLPRPRERSDGAFVELRQQLMAEFGLH